MVSPGPARARRFDAVLLDAGNTLFTERTSRAACYALAARAHGLEIDGAAMAAHMAAVHAALPERVDGHFRYTDPWFRVFVQEVFARAGLPSSAGGESSLEALSARLFAVFRDPATFRVFPDVRPVLTRLKGAGIRLGVVSNWSPSLPALLSRLGFAGDFGTIATSAIAQREKPAPALFRRALDALGIAPERALHVGDRPDNDVEGARAAGIEALLLDRDGRHAPAPHRIESLLELLPRVGLPPV